MKLENLLLRQQIISLTRSFFDTNKFQEITPPSLVTKVPKEQNIYPFTTKWQHSSDNLYLSTSPESGLKQLISSQVLGNCYAISPSFRNLEAKGPTHQPEFLMLEWYRLNSSYRQIIEDTQKYIIYINRRIRVKKGYSTNNILKYQKTTFNLTPPWPQISLKDLFSQYASLPLPATEVEINQIFLNRIEKHLKGFRQPVFITHYPSFMSPLAKTLSGSNEAERFELYFGNLEIANGCTENQNPSIETPWKKLPPCAGCGLGIDRLAMLFTDSDTIEAVIPLPL